MQAGCPQTCRRKCHLNLSTDERQDIFNKYWLIGNVEKQWQFISNNVTEEQKKRTHLRSGNKSSRREISRQFFFNAKHVCKTMFLDSLGITDKVMRTALSKTKNGFTQSDWRGTTKNRKYGENVIEVKNHIKSFPIMESHYVRKRCQRSFMSSELNLSKLYFLYTQSNPTTLVGEKTYQNIFNTCFNIGLQCVS